MAKITYLQAVRDALAEEMRKDNDIFYTGVDVRQSAFGQTKGLVDEFGKNRILNTPIAESTIPGIAYGAALRGMRPVFEIMFIDFVGLAMDHIHSQVGSGHYIYGGKFKLPITMITSTGGANGGSGHSQELSVNFLHSPGWIICVPSNAYDAKGLMKAAIRSDDPVMVHQHRTILLSNRKIEVPDEEYVIPFGVASVVQEGSDVTIVATMSMVKQAVKAAKELAREGISAEVIDPRTIRPLDMETITESLKKTGNLIVAEEARFEAGLGSEIIARIMEKNEVNLKGFKRVAPPMIPIPLPDMAEVYLPRMKEIAEAARTLVSGKVTVAGGIR